MLVDRASSSKVTRPRKDGKAEQGAKGLKARKGKKKVKARKTGKCCKCGEKGHWKPDCPKKGKGPSGSGIHQANVLKTHLATVSTNQ